MAREMKDSGVEWIGEIPRNWDVHRLKTDFSFGKGLPITKEHLTDEGIDVISYGQIHSKNNTMTSIDDGLIKHVDVSYSESNPEAATHIGDFIFADTSEDTEGCGNCVYIDRPNVYAGYHTIILKSLLSLDNKYFAYLFKTDCWRSQLRADAAGVKLFSITKKMLAKCTTIVPEIDEQIKITAFLDKECSHIDSIINKTRSTIEEYKALKQSIITEAVTKGVRGDRPMKNSGIEWIGEIPEGWDTIKYGRKTTVKSNLVHPEDYPDYPQISPDNIEKGNAKLLSNYRSVKDTGVISDNHLFHANQIVYSKVRPILNKLFIAEFDGLCSADMYPIETEYPAKLLVYIMLSEIFLAQVKMVTEDRVKMPKINQEELASLVIVDIPMEEHLEIMEYLDEKCDNIDALIEQKGQLITELESYKKSLIYEYVTGKKEVPGLCQ